MIDQGWNAAIWIEFNVVRRFVLAFLEVEVNGLVCQPELLEDDGDLPNQHCQQS